MRPYYRVPVELAGDYAVPFPDAWEVLMSSADMRPYQLRG